MSEREQNKESNLDKKLIGFGSVGVLVGLGFKVGLIAELSALAIVAGVGVHVLKGKKDNK